MDPVEGVMSNLDPGGSKGERGMDWLELRASRMGMELFKALAVCYLRSVVHKDITESKSYLYPGGRDGVDDLDLQGLIQGMDGNGEVVEISVRMVGEEEV